MPDLNRINALVAERVMEWTPSGLGAWMEAREHDLIIYHPGEEWNPTSDWNQMSQVIEAMRKKGYEVTLESVITNNPAEVWNSAFDGPSCFAGFSAATATLSVCIAALGVVLTPEEFEGVMRG